jgi:manganese transport protein
MEGFMKWTLNPVVRRAFTRLIAIIPSVIVISIGGDKLTNQLLILSQVTLSFALPFAVIPLVHVTGSKAHMGDHVNSTPVKVLSYMLALFLIALNLMLIV